MQQARRQARTYCRQVRSDAAVLLDGLISMQDPAAACKVHALAGNGKEGGCCDRVGGQAHGQGTGVEQRGTRQAGRTQILQDSLRGGWQSASWAQSSAEQPTADIAGRHSRAAALDAVCKVAGVKDEAKVLVNIQGVKVNVVQEELGGVAQRRICWWPRGGQKAMCAHTSRRSFQISSMKWQHCSGRTG